MPPKQNEPTGIDLTDRLIDFVLKFQRMAPTTKIGKIDLATAFIPVAYTEATDRYQNNRRRGLILASQGDPIKIWWIAQENIATIPGASDEALEVIGTMLKEYKPFKDAVIVRQTSEGLEPFHVIHGGKVNAPGIFPNKP